MNARKRSSIEKEAIFLGFFEVTLPGIRIIVLIFDER